MPWLHSSSRSTPTTARSPNISKAIHRTEDCTGQGSKSWSQLGLLRDSRQLERTVAQLQCRYQAPPFPAVAVPREGIDAIEESGVPPFFAPNKVHMKPRP